MEYNAAMEKFLLETAEGYMQELIDEVKNYNGEYKLLTHYGNINALLGKWYATLDVLDAMTENSKGYPAWCSLYEKYEPFVQETCRYIESCNGKFKEV